MLRFQIFLGLYCQAAWDSFICWPPMSPGEKLSRPCPQMDVRGLVVGETTDPGI